MDSAVAQSMNYLMSLPEAFFFARLQLKGFSEGQG